MVRSWQSVWRLVAQDVWHAPHLLDTEVHHVLRRLDARQDLTALQVDAARRSFLALTVDRYPHAPLSWRVWELRSVLSADDATYVALAEELDATLITTDARIVGAPGVRATIETY
jgi:predicted nucleic acid-binding protein